MKSRCCKLFAVFCSILCFVSLISCAKDSSSNKESSFIESKNAKIIYFDENELPKILVSDEKSAVKAIDSMSDEIGINNVKENIKIVSVRNNEDNTSYRFQQYYKSYPVYGRTVSLSADNNGKVLSMSSGAFRNIEDVDVSIKADKETIKKNIKRYLGSNDVYEISSFSKENLCFYITDSEKPVLCYQIDTKTNQGDYLVFANAKNGNIEKSICKTVTGNPVKCYNSNGTLEFDGYFENSKNEYQMYNSKKNILIFSCENTNSRTSKGKQTFITSADEFFGNTDRETNLETDNGIVFLRNIESIRDYFIRNYSDSADEYLFCWYNDGFDNGGNGYATGGISDSKDPIPSGKNVGIISIGKNKDLETIDLLAHEYMHRVESNISNMDYCGESGAIMEAYSDVFGEIIEANLSNSSESDWIHNGIRNLINPETSNYPKFYHGDNFVNTKDTSKKNDYGGVHKNSTVISHAAYLMQRGYGGNGLSLKELSDIWYRSLDNINISNPTFYQCAKAIYNAAKTTKGITKDKLNSISSAFNEVGIYGVGVMDSYYAYKGTTLSVKDIEEKPYTNYNISVFDRSTYTIVLDEDVTIDNYILNLNEGNYLCTISNNENKDNDLTYSFFVEILNSKNSKCKDNIVILTNYGNVLVNDFSIPQDEVVTIGEIDVIEPEIDPADATGYSFKWSSSDESVATVSPTGEAGIITALKKGTTTITAELTSGGKTVTKSTKLRVASKARDTVLVLDVSGSMGGTPIKEMKKSAVNFCKELLTDEYNNRIGLVFYDNKITSIDLTDDLSVLTSRIEAIKESGTTNMEAGISSADQMLSRLGKSDAIKNVVIMADGLPNQGKVSTSGSMPTGNYNSYYTSSLYANAVIDTAKDMMNKYNLYSLGFFHSLYDEEKDFATTLMKSLTNQSAGYHQVDKAEDLQFAFGDISDEISYGSKIVVNIACPVDVKISYGGETLSNSTESYCDNTSFGTLQLLGKNKDIKVVSLDSDKDYDVELSGTGDGKMDYTVNYFDKDENLNDYRSFESVPITTTTAIKSKTDNSNDVTLNVDEDGDGETDKIWTASAKSKGNITYDKNAKEPEKPPKKETVKKDSGLSTSEIVAIVVIISVIFVAGVLLILVLTKKEEQSTEADSNGTVICPICHTSHLPSEPCKGTAPDVMENVKEETEHGNIVIESGSMKGQQISLKDGMNVYLGKDTKFANLVFSKDYKNVSRLHCSVTYDAKSECYYVIDSSTNGTYFENKKRLTKGQRTKLTPNTVLLLANGDCTIRLC